MDQKYDIIVLTWNRREIIKAFVESFLANTPPVCRLIIIDNGSTDGTKDYLLSLEDAESCAFKIIINRENRGFVGGMNQGIEISDAAYVCLANNDLIFTKGWLEEIVSIFEKDGRIGILNPNSNNLGAHPPHGMPIDDFGRKLSGKYKGVFVEMPFCIGFCMFIRREVIQKIGGLSEEFHPFFFEDSDYSMKAKKAGYLIGVAKGSYVWHKEHASFKQMGREREEFFVKNSEIFRRKWGKTLRIVWIMSDQKEISKVLEEAIGLARQGNFVWFMVKNLAKSDLFEEENLIEHSAVNFIKIRNRFDIIWKILKKKKRYDIIISNDNFMNWLFKKLGYVVLKGLDKDRIKDIKYANL